MQIKIDIARQLPKGIPTVTDISDNCTNNPGNPTFPIHSRNCEKKFIGRTNDKGQILLFENSYFPPGIFHTSYVIATVEDAIPIDNAIVDGTINYTSTNSGIDVFGVSITSAFVHAIKPDFSDWTDIYWPM